MQRKKLLLLSAIVLLMGTKSYGTLYPTNGEVITQDKITEGHLNSKPNNKGESTVISVKKDVGAVIDREVKIESFENENKDILKKLINIASEDLDIITTNNGIIKGTNNGGKGIEIISIQSGNFVNNGTIGISGTTGKGISISGAKGKAENNKEIIVENGASGAYVNNANANFKNNETGKIYVTGINSKGIEINKGTATNEGEIIVNGGEKLNSSENQPIGIKVAKNGSFTNKNKITVIGTTDKKESNYQSKGILVEVDGKATNEINGKIDVSSAGIGVLVKGTFTNDGTIIADDMKSKGVVLSGGILVNSGEISGTNLAIESSKDTNNTIYLKNRSKVTGKIAGNTGVDILALEGKIMIRTVNIIV